MKRQITRTYTVSVTLVDTGAVEGIEGKIDDCVANGVGSISSHLENCGLQADEVVHDRDGGVEVPLDEEGYYANKDGV